MTIAEDSFIIKATLDIEAQLDALVRVKEVPFKNLYEAARYSLLGSGKRLRPVLMLAATETFGGNTQQAIRTACAMEMIHTYSLIHDDLPCMDDDDFRRGKPSLHKAFPEGHAVLAGDFLLTYAFEVLCSDPFLRTEQKLALIALFAKNAGDKGMIAGQIMDIEAEGKEIDLEHLGQIHRYKTGALISTALEAGGIIAGASEKDINAVKSFGDDIGLAFQIIDDILDVTASKMKHGKSVSSDLINDKTTYVSLLGLDKARIKADNLLISAKAKLRSLSRDTTLLEQLAEFIISRKT